MCINEEWRKVNGYEGYYEVSNTGRVRSVERSDSYPIDKEQRILRPSISNGYRNVTLCKGGRIKRFAIHRLVAKAFISNPHNLPCVNHIDENRANNNISNLEWVTQRQNLTHSHVQEKMLKAAHKANEKKVLMYDRNGNFIKGFESATKAAKAIGGYQQNVSVCCRDWAKTTKGYKFQFKED